MLLKFLKRLIFGRKISQISYKKFHKRLSDIQQKDEYRKVIEYDKLYHHILVELGYTGSFGNILKKNPKEIPDIKKIWKLHKLRNKLVHDENTIPISVLKKSSLEYHSEIQRCLKKIVK